MTAQVKFKEIHVKHPDDAPNDLCLDLDLELADDEIIVSVDWGDAEPTTNPLYEILAAEPTAEVFTPRRNQGPPVDAGKGVVFSDQGGVTGTRYRVAFSFTTEMQSAPGIPVKEFTRVLVVEVDDGLPPSNP